MPEEFIIDSELLREIDEILAILKQEQLDAINDLANRRE